MSVSGAKRSMTKAPPMISVEADFDVRLPGQLCDRQTRFSPIARLGLLPRKTGLPFTVWLRRSASIHETLSIEVSPSSDWEHPRANFDDPDCITVILEPEIVFPEETVFDNEELAMLAEFINQNIALIEEHWFTYATEGVDLKNKVKRYSPY